MLHPVRGQVKCLVREDVDERLEEELARRQKERANGQTADLLPFRKSYFRESATRPKIAQDMLGRLRKYSCTSCSGTAKSIAFASSRLHMIHTIRRHNKHHKIRQLHSLAGIGGSIGSACSAGSASTVTQAAQELPRQ